ncbi:sugar MFS transporter [Peptoniphilus sp.]|jgi:FHS family L-fucose permease-like MFS transporter|uniref:sugar MFS transporter n=1 Tax=Peptoniphilus sp. TaxID=1971214 RepID=UPI003D92A5A6
MSNDVTNKRGSKATIAIVLVTFLFFAWGLTMNLVNALNTPMANYMEISATKASLLQMAYFGAYFFLAIPASIVAKKHGYKVGIMMGLALFVIGSLLTIPATSSMNYNLFLLAMFITASGAATLETNCNPYITKLGDPEKEAFRLNLAQSFNGVGNIVGPFILGSVIGETLNPGDAGFEQAKASFLDGTKTIYIGIAIALAIVLAIFFFVKLPTPPGDEEANEENTGGIKKLFEIPHFALGVLAAFIFIGLQVGGMALFSSYSLEHWEGMSAGTATKYLGIVSLLFTVGRFVTTPLMSKFKPNKILGVYMSLSAILMVIVALGLGKVSVIAFIISYLFISIGFPTIYSLSLVGLTGNDAKTGASILTMSIVGAAIIPVIMSAIGDKTSLQVAMGVTVIGFIYCAWYGFVGSKKGLEA